MYPLTDFQKKCVALMNAAPHTHATHCFRSALDHLERAEALREFDPAMACFRAITAEEEAASGVMLCLREMMYPKAEALKRTNHRHKHAVFPFLQVLKLFFEQTFAKHCTEYRLHIKKQDGADRLLLALNVKVNEVIQWAYPIPPLNFDAKYPNTDEAPDFSYQIDQQIKARGKATIRAFVSEEANLRNKVLYASPSGGPAIGSLDVRFLNERRTRVLAMIYLYLLVYPYQEHQPFVSQALDAFVKLLAQLEKKRDPA